MDGSERGDGDAPANDTGAGPTVRVRYRDRLGDHLRAGAWVARQSDVQVGMGVVGMLSSPLGVVCGLPELALTFVLGLSLVTGWIAVPFVWWIVRRQPGLVAEIENVIDSTGITERSPRMDAHIPWSTYRYVVETRDAFYLSTGMAAGFLPKHALTGEQVAYLRRIVADARLMRGPRRLRRVVVTVVILLVLVASVLGPIALSRLNPTPRIDLMPTVEGTMARVQASSDMPDGAFLAVQVFHIDGWTRSLASGASESSDSEWVHQRYVILEGGRFDVSFPVTGWPAGRLRAVVYFDMTMQPSAVVERYGERGERLSGPFVSEGQYGREVELWEDFELR